MFKPHRDDPLRVRRHVALLAILVVVGTMITMLALAKWGNEHSAPVLSAIATVIGSIDLSLLGLTGAWFHAAYKKDQKDG